MYKNDSFDMEEEDGDQDKQLETVEKRKSGFEKKLYLFLIVIMVLSWIFVFQEILLEYGEKEWKWKHEKKPKNVLP